MPSLLCIIIRYTEWRVDLAVYEFMGKRRGGGKTDALYPDTYLAGASDAGPPRGGYRRYIVPGPMTRRGAHENMWVKNFFEVLFLFLHGGEGKL